MTDNEIIKAWDKVLKMGDAPIGEHWQVGITTRLAKDTFDMLNRKRAESNKYRNKAQLQKRELARLNNQVVKQKAVILLLQLRVETLQKDFADRLKCNASVLCDKVTGLPISYTTSSYNLNRLMKEMEGEGK